MEVFNFSVIPDTDLQQKPMHCSLGLIRNVCLEVLLRDCLDLYSVNKFFTLTTLFTVLFVLMVLGDKA